MLYLPNKTFISPYDKEFKIQFYKKEHDEIKIEDEREFKYYKGTYILVGSGQYDINPSFMKYYDCIYMTRYPIDFKNLYYMKIYFVNNSIFSNNIPTNIWSFQNISNEYKGKYLGNGACSITSMLKVINIKDNTNPVTVNVYPKERTCPYVLSLSYLGKT